MDQSLKILFAEEELKKLGSFLEKHDRLLSDLIFNSPFDTNLPKTCTFNEPLRMLFSTDQENISLLKLIESDKLLNKSILTFAYICSEIDDIAVDAHERASQFLFLDENLSFVDTPEINKKSKEMESCFFKISCSLDFLCNLKFLIQRCIILGCNLLQQCAAFLSNENVFDLKFSIILDSLATILLYIVIFDEILLRSNYNRSWKSYERTLEKLIRNGYKSNIYTDVEVTGFINCIHELEYIFSGKLFQCFMESTFIVKEKIGSKTLSQFGSLFQEYLRNNILKMEKLPQDLCEFNETEVLIRINAFCVLSYELFGQFDLKLLKSLLEINNKHMGIILIGNVIWMPTSFLKKHAESLIRTFDKLFYDPVKQQNIYLDIRVQNLQRDCKQYCTQISLWTINMRNMLQMSTAETKLEIFKTHSFMLLHGLQLMGQLSYIIKGMINMHVWLKRTMTRNTLMSVCKLIELLKLLQLTFQSDVEKIARIINCILQYLQYKALHIVLIAKKKITNATMHDRNIDALAALKIAEKCLQGSGTRLRILIANLAVSATCSVGRLLSNEFYENYFNIINRIKILIKFQDNLKQLYDTSFVYWHQSILSSYLKQVVEKRIDFNSFQYLVKSCNDCGQRLEMLELGNLTLTDILKTSNSEHFKAEIISCLCAQVETFLRLEVHSNLQLGKTNPFEESIKDYRDLINICPMELNKHHIIVKDHIENYLSSMFYNLTTISLHDWKTYEEMRQLGSVRLNLHPIDDYLPNQTIEQGIDVLEIMRNIHIFVSKYVYNMNTQIFVQHKSSNKHLDTIGIRHIANSLRTHGTGIINTTVNFIYQFLRQKFYIFSQFLYDEQIKSRLMKEFRALVENRQNLESLRSYPYERADAFNKDIRKLGLSQDGQTYMDLFRKVISHVGNAMGYIRLVRSGSIHANYSASIFLPKFDENLKFVEYAEVNQLSDVTKTATNNLETNLHNLFKSFSDGTDFFHVLVEVFQPFFHNPNNIHLKNFYLIVPALILNYVEYILSAKEKTSKKDREDAVLFDDGFTVGLAYVLKLLNQISEFNSLHWFNTVNDRFETERRKIKNMQNDISSSIGRREENEKLQQTLALTEKRIISHQMEYNFLYYNLCSAKVFFQ